MSSPCLFSLSISHSLFQSRSIVFSPIYHEKNIKLCLPKSLSSFSDIGGDEKRKPPPMHRKRRLREPVKIHRRRRNCMKTVSCPFVRLYKRSSQAFLQRFPCPCSTDLLGFPRGKSVSSRPCGFTPISSLRRIIPQSQACG